jgi:hypothetical protein
LARANAPQNLDVEHALAEDARGNHCGHGDDFSQ